MELAVNETKIQAKKLLKAIKSNHQLFDKYPLLKKMGVSHIDDLQLKHTLAIIAIKLGFKSWQQASTVLTGQRQTNALVNMGILFYPPAGHGLTNEWFADYQSAQFVLRKANNKWLFPYKNQFIVVGTDYLKAFGFNDEILSKFHLINNDMQDSYNTQLWDEITRAVIKNTITL